MADSSQRSQEPPYEDISPISEQEGMTTPRAFHPSTHPDSAFRRLQNQRFSLSAPKSALPPSQPPSLTYDVTTPHPPHPPPPFPSSPAIQNENPEGPNISYSQSIRTTSTVTPGADNLGSAAVGGGIGGIALGVAGRHERESGLQVMNNNNNNNNMADTGNGQFNAIAERGYPTTGSDTLASPALPHVADGLGRPPSLFQQRDSYGSSVGLGTADAGPGQGTPGRRTPIPLPSHPSQYSLSDQINTGYYGAGGLYDGPYQIYGARTDEGSINPDDIVDDGDDGFMTVPKRRSALALGHRNSRAGMPAAADAAEVAASAGGLAGIGGRVFSSNRRGVNSGPSYGPVPGSGPWAGTTEKSGWLDEEAKQKKRRRLLLTFLVVFVIIALIVGGVVGGILGSRSHNSSSGTSDQTASGDQGANGDLDLNSPEIQQLLNNTNLHKVFPGMDYTPWGVQYPLCLTYPPDQNNVTRDMAVLSQLTNSVRLYGTDCNQTEMVLHAIDRLELTDMKVWLGVWIDTTNDTTNDRQLEQLYKIVSDAPDKSIFKGAIVGNEVLYRADNSAAAMQSLIDYMTYVRSNLTKMGAQMPVATSDLGDNWTPEIAQASDFVMANVHPFFGGVAVAQAASWTTTFFQTHDVDLAKETDKKAIIAETGWPSGGGNDCGTDAACSSSTAGSIAGISEMNQFMSDWVCQALANGTEYFW